MSYSKSNLIRHLTDILIFAPYALIKIIVDYQYEFTIKYLYSVNGSSKFTTSQLYYIYNDTVFLFGSNSVCTYHLSNFGLNKTIPYKNNGHLRQNLLLRTEDTIYYFEYYYYGYYGRDYKITFVLMCQIKLQKFLITMFDNKSVSYKIEHFYKIINYKNMVYLLTKDKNKTYFQVLNPFEKQDVKIIILQDQILMDNEKYYPVIKEKFAYIVHITRSEANIFIFTLHNNQYDYVTCARILDINKQNMSFDLFSKLCYIEDNVLYLSIILNSERVVSKSGILSFDMVENKIQNHFFDYKYNLGEFINCHTSKYFILLNKDQNLLYKFIKQVV